MNSIAQHAVTNGYGNSENLRAQPTNSSFFVEKYSNAGVGAFAMGATVPVFARVAGAHGTALAALYGANTLGAAAGLGYVSDERGVTEERITSGHFEILIGNRTVPVRASLSPLYDPRGTRPRG